MGDGDGLVRARVGDLVGSSPWISPDARRVEEDGSSPEVHKAYSRRRVYLDRFSLQLQQLSCPLRSWTVWAVALLALWLISQAVILQLSLEETRDRPLGPAQRQHMRNLAADPDFVKSVANAFDEWRILQERFPDRFSNFSQFLMEEKMKETKLRHRLSNLSKASIDLVANIIVPPAQSPPKYSKEDEYELEWTYLMREKAWPYVGSDRYIDLYRPNTRAYWNSLAVFPHANRTRLHGLVGMFPNGTRAWRPDPMPPPIDEFPGGKSKALIDGGFYLNLSNALPLDRETPDSREEFCAKEVYEIDKYEDASVVITFYNEHPSTLLRSVHSVLNMTPPPLLREIILVDDHSNNTAMIPGGYIYEYIKLLPKVKLMRLPERRGLVQARLAGAKLSKAPVLVVLDSHIEVNVGWLEPQMKRLYESPKSVVFPQILGIDTGTLEAHNRAGIGCFLSYKWIMQERPYFSKPESAKPVPSPSMAGGLFAVRRDWFFEAGGYDEEFSMWGAENVEMAFRHWMCGGRVECTPCANTYHIYRQGGSGYKSPGEYIKKNRIRTARLWLDDWWQVARYFLNYTDIDQGSYDKMLELKERLHCKDFKWFLENVDPTREGTRMDGFGLLGDIRSLAGAKNECVDNLAKKLEGETWGIYRCHGDRGSQGWFHHKQAHRIRSMQSENLCLGNDFKFTYCNKPSTDAGWHPVPERRWLAFKNDLSTWQEPFDLQKDFKCLALPPTTTKLEWHECVEGDVSIEWAYLMFERDESLERPTYSAEYLEKQRLRNSMAS